MNNTLFDIVVLHQAGQWSEAKQGYLALLAEATLPQADQQLLLSNLAALYVQEADYVSALPYFEQAQALGTLSAGAYSNWLKALCAQEVYTKAWDVLQSAEQAYPKQYVLLLHKQKILEVQQQFTASAEVYAQLLLFTPNDAELHNSYGFLLNQLDRFAEALPLFLKAIALDASKASFYINAGYTLKMLGRYAESAPYYQQAMQVDAQSDGAFCLALYHLYEGNYAEGFKLYEARFNLPNLRYIQNFSAPRFTGQEVIKGKTLLIHAEQGLGDTLQMLRFVTVFCQRHTDVHIALAVHVPLIALVAQQYPRATIVPMGTVYPQHDYHCPMMSLPLVLGITLPDLPAVCVPYLHVPVDLKEKWQRCIANIEATHATNPAVKHHKHVGLVWSGNPQFSADDTRSMTYGILAPVLEACAHLPVRWHCLHKEFKAEEAAHAAQTGVHIWADALQHMGDTAALIEQMDLVITVDTSVAHLAGALGKPTWLVVAHLNDWRWLANRTDSPWYPTITIFRQTHYKVWQDVLNTLTCALRAFLV